MSEALGRWPQKVEKILEGRRGTFVARLVPNVAFLMPQGAGTDLKASGCLTLPSDALPSNASKPSAHATTLLLGRAPPASWLGSADMCI